MPLDITRTREYLNKFDFPMLFIEELGWDRHAEHLEVSVDGQRYILTALAEKRGMVAFICPPQEDGSLPAHAIRRTIERQVARSVHEHLLLYTDAGKTTQVWQWVKRKAGEPTRCREHTYYHHQVGDALIQKLQAIAFSFEEEEHLTIVDVTSRVRAAFDVDRVTKRFYERFKSEHATFLKFIKGIQAQADREWYASLMLNRLMFVYFIQKKGFLDGDRNYLRNRLHLMEMRQGMDTFLSFYRYFLLRLFHEGLGARKRTTELDALLGNPTTSPDPWSLTHSLT